MQLAALFRGGLRFAFQPGHRGVPAQLVAEDVEGIRSLESNPSEGVTVDASKPGTEFRGQRIRQTDGERLK